MFSPISFKGTYKINYSDNKSKLDDIHNVANKLFISHQIETDTEFKQVKNGTEIIWTIPADDSLDSEIDNMLISRGIKFSRKSKDELLSEENIKSRIKIPDSVPNNRYSLVEVKTDKFNEFYKKYGDAYVGDGENVNFPNRLASVPEFLLMNKDIDASIVYIRDSYGYPQIDFQDGRHRYAYMRNRGFKSIPLAMDNESILVAKKYGLM